MSYLINLGGWSSVFAVPSAVVDNGLKLASESQLKVVLYVLRHGGEKLTDENISDALGIHPDDVRDAIEYWISKGLFISLENELTIPQNSAVHNVVPEEPTSKTTVEETVAQKTRSLSRAQKPEPAYVRERIKGDKSLAVLMSEAELMLGRLLSQPDTATLLMLHDTDGLPVDVILMLIGYCKSIGKGNMRYIEKTGIGWANEGILTINLAEEKIKRYSLSTSAWETVAAVFGIRLSGSPTEKQLEFAGRWVNEWLFSESMLRLAYERCVDAKGEAKLPYINGILKKWYEQSLKTPDDVMKADSQTSAKKNKKGESAQNSASYDLDAYESKSIFDD